MSPERIPTEYKNRHQTSISLDTYKGVASDIMEINPPVADGFMSRADMRSDIYVVKKDEDRSRDYETLGEVVVSKRLRLPQFSEGNKIHHVVKQDGVWVIKVDDQQIADKAARLDNGKRFDDKFIDNFKTEVARGLKEALFREKIFNGEQYNFYFYAGVAVSALQITKLSVFGLIAIVENSGPLALSALTDFAAYNLIYNVIDLFAVLKNKILRLDPPLIDPNQPFIKHSVVEQFLPILPIDRIIRGNLYLNKNGETIIQKAEEKG